MVLERQLVNMARAAGEALIRATERMRVLAPPQDQGQLRLATFNIGGNRDRFYNEAFTGHTKAAFKKLIKQYPPNVICAQEISMKGIDLVLGVLKENAAGSWKCAALQEGPHPFKG